MRITENRLRQIIRSTLLQESIGKSEYNSYFLLKRVVDWALRNKMGMSGNAQLGDRESSWNEMTQQRYGKFFVVPPIELYDAVRARLLASPKVSAVSMDVEMGGEMSGAFSVGVYGIPGWPSPMTHDDFYQAAQFIKRNPAMADLVAAYEADFGDDSDPETPASGGDLMEFVGDEPRDDREDRPFELSRGMVFMIIDLILNSAPKGNTSFLINDVDMEIMVFKPSHPVPAGMTMGRLLAGGGMRDTGARRAPDRLSIATPDAVSDDDVNESRRHDMRITRGQLQQIIREETRRALNEGVDGRTEMLDNALAKLPYVEHYLLLAKRAEREEGLEVDPALDDLIERLNSCGADLLKLIRRTQPRPVRNLREAHRDREEGTGYEYLRDMPDTVHLVDGPVDEKWLNKRLNHFRDFPPRMLPMVLIDFVRMLKGEPVGADVVEMYTNRDGTSNVTRQTIEALVDELLGPSWRD